MGLDHAGTAGVRLDASAIDPEAIARRAEKRASAFGMHRHLIAHSDAVTEVLAIRAGERRAERDDAALSSCDVLVSAIDASFLPR